MKKIIFLLVTVLFVFAVSACEEIPGIEELGSASGSAPTVSADDYIPEGSDTLPQEIVGSWSVKEVYQEARATDIAPADGLASEALGFIRIDYVAFSHNDTTVDGPIFTVKTGATISDLYAAGIQPDAFGADTVVDIISVKQSVDGSSLESVYLIDKTTLLAFGAGGHVYTYEAVEAVG